jgi:hypothetical protein
VRGRRFVRPTLVWYEADGAEHQALADLEDKPWAADDGRAWRAVFLTDPSLDRALTIELTVAPDITVILRGTPPADPPRPRVRPQSLRTPSTETAIPSGSDADPGSRASVTPASSTPSSRQPVPSSPRRPSARAYDVERLESRLASSQSALQREQQARVETETALDVARREIRQLDAELARVRAELELAQAGEREGVQAATTLDDARRELHDLRSRHDALAAEHERTLRARTALEAETRERSGELTATRDALAAARGEVQATRETVLRERAAHADELRGAAERGEAAGRDDAGRDEVDRDEDREPPASLRVSRDARDARLAERERGRDRQREPRPRESVALQHHTPPPPRSDRPVNPALRTGNWLVRLIALLVLAAIVVAVYVVLKSTVL